MNKWIKPLRTFFQVVLAVLPMVPVLVPAIGLSATAGVGASVVGVAVFLSRLMATDAAELALSRLGLHTKQPEK